MITALIVVVVACSASLPLGGYNNEDLSRNVNSPFHNATASLFDHVHYHRCDMYY
jgi:hypothetical protein